MPSGLISTSSGAVSESRISATSFGKGAALSPWKDRVQSTFSSPLISSSSGLSDSPVLEMLLVVWWFGVEEVTPLLLAEGEGEVEDGEDGYEEDGNGDDVLDWFCCLVGIVLVTVLYWNRVELRMRVDMKLLDLERGPDARKERDRCKKDMISELLGNC